MAEQDDPLAEIRLDKTSPVPLYYQVATQLESLIRGGKLAVGTWLDNEIELATRLGLSRPTMRRAIAELVDDGLLVRQRGVGTRVVSADIIRPVELTSLYDDLVATGAEPVTRVLDLHEITPTPELEEEFASKERLVHITRLRGTEAGPLALMHNWIRSSVPGITKASLESRGLYDLLRAAGSDPRLARATIGARAASAEEADLLEIEPAAACLTMRRAAYDASNRLIEVGDHLYRGDIYHFTSTVQAR
jgi:DNA-binding GntR family transcriptional regulator